MLGDLLEIVRRGEAGLMGEAGTPPTVPEASVPRAAPYPCHVYPHPPPPGANPCEHAGKCINTLGSFECQCLQGYTGPRCEIDVNECVSNPCQNDATCLDQIGEFQCICMPGRQPAARPTLGVGKPRRPPRPQPPNSYLGRLELGLWGAAESRPALGSWEHVWRGQGIADHPAPARLRGRALRGEHG